MKVLDNKVCVVTGAGGVLCSSFAEELAKNGAKVALLDLNKDAAQAVADKINAEGGKAIAVDCNVLDKASLEAARAEVDAAFGKTNILINGAGGNNPRGTTDKEYYEEGDLAIEGLKTLTKH